EVRLQHQRPGDGDALPLAAGKLLRIAVHVLFGRRQLHVLQGLHHPPLHLFRILVQALDAQRLGHDAEDVHIGVHGVVRVLEDDLHAPPELPHALRVQPGDVLPVEDDLSRGGLVQAQQRPTRRGLPRSGLAHQPENLAPAHEKVHAVHGPHRRPLALQHLLQAAPQRKVLDEPAHFEKDVVLLVHANFTSAACPSSDTFRQATLWPARPFSASSGSMRLHASSAKGQRGWKRQPAGGLIKLGGVPGMDTMGARSASMSGKAWVSPCVYGCRGLVNTSSTGPYSTMRPAYMTATSSHVWATTERSWLTRIMDRPSRSRRSAMALSTCACTITSSAVVGSSAMTICGLHASAMAMTARCFMPPL